MWVAALSSPRFHPLVSLRILLLFGARAPVLFQQVSRNVRDFAGGRSSGP